MRCTKISNKCSYNPWQQEKMGECCRSHLISISHYLAELFEREKIHYWLHFGSLLGALRENGHMIPWDSDIDIGVLVTKERLLGLKQQIEDDGYAWSQNHDQLIQIGYSKFNWTYVDLWIYEKASRRHHAYGNDTELELSISMDNWVDSDEVIVRNIAPWQQVNHTGDFPFWFIEKVEQIEFEGRLFNCPRHYQKFIELTYGPHWETPQEKDGTGFGGNYYPLSQWFDYVDEQIEHPQRDKSLRIPSSPYCRFDTPACEKSNACCLAHKHEIMHAITDLLTMNNISHVTDFEKFEFNILPENYDKTLALGFDNLATYYDFEALPGIANVYYSLMNKNKVSIKFKKFLVSAPTSQLN